MPILESIRAIFPEEGRFERWWNANSFPPRRCHVLAKQTVGRSTFKVETNRTTTRWWYQEIGDGFAGDGCSRRDWASTTSERKAQRWILAVRNLDSLEAAA